MLLISANLFAEPIGEQRARQIAQDFFSQHSTRAMGNITLEWAGDKIGDISATGVALDSSLLYIYNCGTNGGFVVVAGDSNAAPIIAYSLDTTLDVNDMAESTAAILDAWCRQVASVRKAAKPITGTTMRTTTRSSDEELLYKTALWDQEEPYNLKAPIIDGQRALTGCGATAMAIICYYHRWPERGVGTTPEYSCEVGGATYVIPANELGRKYDYDIMLPRYEGEYTEEQGNAVAALMKDVGTALQMQYHHIASAAPALMPITAFTKYFGYSKQMVYAFAYNYSEEEWFEVVRENLRKYGPVFFTGVGKAGGHAFVVDGYKADDYFHFNFGWSGDGNGYFLLPKIDFYADQSIITGLVPDKDGSTSYVDSMTLYGDDSNHGIFSYQEANYTPGTPFEVHLGSFLNIGVLDFVGDISLVLCDKMGNIKESLYTISDLSVKPLSYFCDGERVSVTITEDIEIGDRLRIYYKGEGSHDWTWARTFYLCQSTFDEVLVAVTPEDIAKGMSVTFDKSTRTLEFQNEHAMKISIYNNETNELVDSADCMMYQVCKFDNLAAGVYRVEASLGGEPYVLNIKL